MILKGAVDALTSVFFPAPCRICARMLVTTSRIPICEACLGEFERIGDPLCVCCGRPFAAVPEDHSRHPESDNLPIFDPLCRLCRSGFYAFDRARSFAVYDRALSEAVLLLKYEQVASLADWFGARLAELAQGAAAEWRPDVVVPVPLHHERRRERGYNQAELIAGAAAKRLKLPFETNFLIRVKPRPAQLVLSRTEHWRSVRGAYATPEGLKIDKLRVLLVDDVLTTGATLDACSRTLKRAGAAAVFGMTVGRVRFGTSAIPAPAQSNSATKLAGRSIYSP